MALNVNGIIEQTLTGTQNFDRAIRLRDFKDRVSDELPAGMTETHMLDLLTGDS